MEEKDLEYRLKLLGQRCFDLECKLKATIEIIVELIPTSTNPDDRLSEIENKIHKQTEILKQELLSGKKDH